MCVGWIKHFTRRKSISHTNKEKKEGVGKVEGKKCILGVGVGGEGYLLLLHFGKKSAS